MGKREKDDNKKADPYKIDKLSKIPSWIIILVLKYWAAAAAVFFMAIGGISIGFDYSKEVYDDPYAAMASSIALILMIGLGLALVNNYIIRPIVRMMYSRTNNTKRFHMINFNGFKSFLVSLLYYFILSIIMFFVVNFLSSKGLILDLFGTAKGIGIEPFSYAFYVTLLDYICIYTKNLIIYITKRVRYKRQMEGELI